MTYPAERRLVYLLSPEALTPPLPQFRRGAFTSERTSRAPRIGRVQTKRERA